MVGQNNKFKEGDIISHPWFNSQQGRFVVINRMYNSHYDDYSLMNCRSYVEAKILADRLNEAISPITKELLDKHKKEKQPQDCIPYEKQWCTFCEFFDGYDMCLRKEIFGAITDETIDKCSNDKIFINKITKVE